MDHFKDNGGDLSYTRCEDELTDLVNRLKYSSTKKKDSRVLVGNVSQDVAHEESPSTEDEVQRTESLGMMKTSGA